MADAINRRSFLAGTATAAFTVVRPSAVRGSTANSVLKVGIIGCGGRGCWIGPFFERHGGYKWTACADYYPDHANRFGEAHKIPTERRFSGSMSAYKKLLESDVDVVVIETPPFFHPQQAADAVAAGKHVYLAKPIAVDVPGCQSVEQSGKQATGKKRAFLVDFQTRANPYYREAVKRVHNGAIGKLVCGWAMYPVGIGHFPAPPTPEDRLRFWYCTREISGDFIVEQSIHTIDVATWIANAAPVRAIGGGGSKKLRAYGNILDHFNTTFWFPGDLLVSFMSNQSTPGAPIEIPCRMYGSKGTIDTDYFNGVWMDGMPGAEYKGAKFKDLYDSGTVVNIKEFHESITKGDFANLTVAPSVRSNLTAIMGRTCGYKPGEMITWDQLVKSTERYEPDLKGLKV